MERGIREFARLFAEQNNNILRDATGRVSNSLVALSPVADAGSDDRGEFVADWDVRIGGFPSDSEQAPDPAKRTTRARLREVIKSAKYGDAIFFENNDPVAVRLEFGYSQKAPQGVVRLTARRWRRFVQGAGRAAINRAKKNLVID